MPLIKIKYPDKKYSVFKAILSQGLLMHNGIKEIYDNKINIINVITTFKTENLKKPFFLISFFIISFVLLFFINLLFSIQRKHKTDT